MSDREKLTKVLEEIGVEYESFKTYIELKSRYHYGAGFSFDKEGNFIEVETWG